MSDYPESGVKLVADTVEYTTAMNDAIFLADYFDSLGTLTLTVVAETDTSGLDNGDLPVDGETIDITVQADVQGDLADLPLDGETVDYTVDATVEGDLADLPLDGDTVNFTADATLTGDELPKDGETIDTTVDVAAGGDPDVLDSVNTLKNLKIVETVWNIAGTAVDLFRNLGSSVVGPMLDLDSAVARVNATTGNAIPNAKELISKIFYSDLGDSIDQVANMVTKAEQMKAPIDEAVTSALQFTKVFSDQSPETTLNTLNALVLNHLAPNFTTAGDMLTTAFQNGANKGGDLLTAINNNATAIHDLGLTGPEALSFIKTGMDNGFTSADNVLKALEKIKQNVQNASGNANSDVTKTLNMLGIANPTDTGKAWSSDFFVSVIAGIQNAPVSDTDKQAMFSNLVGGKMGAKEFSAFMKLSPTDAAAVFENMKGASADAATEIDNSLSGAIDDFMLAAQKAATDFLSSSSIDLPGKIDALKGGLQDALNVLGDGGTLSDALTIALKPIGFDDEFRGLESMLGNFVIAILQAVSFLQSLDPANWKAKAGTDAIIAKQGATQLAFDLKISNPDQIAGDIETAVSRGVTGDQITGTIGKTVDELLASGATAQAQAILDAIKAKQADPSNSNIQLTPSGSAVEVQPTVTPESIALMQQQIDDAKANVQVSVNIDAKTDAAKTGIIGMQNDVLGVQNVLKTATSTNKESILDIQNAVLGLQDNTTKAVQPVVDVSTNVATVTKNSTAAVTPLKNQADATKQVGDTAKTAAPQVGDLSTQVSGIATDAPVAAKGLSALDKAIGDIILRAQGLSDASNKLAVTQAKVDAQTNPDTGHAAGTGDASGTFMTGEEGPEIVTTNQHLAVLNNQTTQAIMAALQGFIPGGSSSGGRGNTYNAYNTNIVQSEAQADSVGYSTAKQLRGMA